MNINTVTLLYNKDYTRSDHCLKSNVRKQNSRINYARIHWIRNIKQTSNTIITQAYHLRCSSWEVWIKASIASDFATLLRIMHQSIPPAPRPPRAAAGHVHALSVLGVGHLQIFALPGGRAFANPRPFPRFSHARGFLSEYNYTEGFTGKKADWLIYQGQE